MEYNFNPSNINSELEDYLMSRINIRLADKGPSSISTSFILSHLVTTDRALEVMDDFVVQMPKVIDKIKDLALFEPTFPNELPDIETIDSDLYETYLARFMKRNIIDAAIGRGKYAHILKPLHLYRHSNNAIQLVFGVYWTKYIRYIKASSFESVRQKQKDGSIKQDFHLVTSTDGLFF